MGGEYVKAVYCLQYKVGGPNGMTIQKAGIVFMQFMSWDRHWTRLLTLGEIFKHRIADFSAKVACTHARQDTAASSSKAPESILSIMKQNEVAFT